MTYTYHAHYRCFACQHPLTDQQVTAAVDASGFPLDTLVFFCPSHVWEDGCDPDDYSPHTPAIWRPIFRTSTNA